MYILVGNTKIDLSSLKGVTKTSFVKKFKSVFAKPDVVYETIKDKIPKKKKKKS